MRASRPNRRQLLGSVGALVAGAAAGPATAAGQAPPPPLVPREDLVNTLEYEAQARRNLPAAAFAQIAGGDRAAFDRVTLHPRHLVPTLDMDLTATLFGDAHFTPILVGPIANQQRFHADGVLATVKGASAAKAAMVVSSESSVPFETIAAQATSPLWYQVFAADPAARAQMQGAVTLGCRTLCVTVGARPAAGARAGAAPAPVDWAVFAALKKSVAVPVLVKGVTTPAAARLALQNGADGLIVSDYGGLAGVKGQAPILALADIVDAVGGKVPVLVDGSFRRGTDILKALAFGARGVLVGRPVMWGLAAYGAAGVQGVVEMLQTELARYMGMCGKSTLQMLDRSVVRVHANGART